MIQPSEFNPDRPPADPLALFDDWYAEYQRTEPIEPGAMTLATTSADGRPSARTVLLRGHTEGGFRFFTNYQSRKAAELSARPWGALLFFWYHGELRRQIRVEGRVERLSAADSDAYFAARPRGHRLAARAAVQSSSIADRASLLAALADVEEQFRDQPVPRPEGWGGYQVIPDRYEFWQDGEHRLHDRLHYEWVEGAWSSRRLCP